MSQTETIPYYARRNAQGYYTYKGQKLQSVTTKLAYAPGSHLIPWAGKQAVLDCCKFLVMAGVSTEDGEILDYATDVSKGSITLEAAVDEILNWRVRMLAHERYRDWKAMIGSLGHHWIYNCAMKLSGADPKRLLGNEKLQLRTWGLDWLRDEAISLNIFRDYLPTEKQLDDLAFSAYTYCLSSSEWIVKAKPKWTMSGLEAMVVHPSVDPDHEWWEECLVRRCGITPAQFDMLPDSIRQLVLDRMNAAWAGTVDGFFEIYKEDYEYKWYPSWGEAQSARATFWFDIKHSNAINHKAVQAQVSAYAACDRIVLIETGDEHELPKADFIASLHVGPHAGALGIQTEFGLLESKANQIGAALYTYPNDPGPTDGFYGLAAWCGYCDNVPRAHQQRARPTGPKETKPKRDEFRPPNFG